MADKRIRTDKHSQEWVFAQKCWRLLVNGEAQPEVPVYNIYESFEGSGKEKLVGNKPINPKKVTYKGTTWF